MAEKIETSKRNRGTVIQFTLVGLVIFSACLMVAAGVVSLGVAKMREGKHGAGQEDRGIADARAENPKEPDDIPPWGELVAYDVDMERPTEYIAFEIDSAKTPAWIFENMTPAQAGETMRSCGLTPAQVEQALSSVSLAVSNKVVMTPNESLLLSLSPSTRSKFYAELSHFASNHYMQYPFCFPGNSFETSLGKENVAGLGLVRKLLYSRGNAECFSDLEMVARSLPNDSDRVALVKALSRQSAVLLRVRIRPETDVNRLLGYWGRGVQRKDIQPLIESIQRLEGGGTVSVVYLLPQFARDRLYTYPFGSNPGDPTMDCHWTTMNFFNAIPDNRFSNPQYTVAYLQTNYYRIAQPGLLGDRIFLIDERGNAIHSAVYIADDIVFTKNGDNFTQPWTLMRMKDLLANYSQLEKTPQVIVYRSRSG